MSRSIVVVDEELVRIRWLNQGDEYYKINYH